MIRQACRIASPAPTGAGLADAGQDLAAMMCRAAALSGRKLFGLAAMMFAVMLTGSQAMAYEEPRYQVLDSTKDYEVRRYAPYIVAEVDVDGDLAASGRDAFRRLAGYIFGGNREQQKMQMTTPVETAPVMGPGESQAGNAPVSVVSRQNNAYRYGFVMESRYSLDTLPRPVDPGIMIRQKPARTVAVRTFSGRWSESRISKAEQALLEALDRDGLGVAGPPTLARYNGPFTPWFLRRNEIWVELLEPSSRLGEAP
jgi:hypothetical protein